MFAKQVLVNVLTAMVSVLLRLIVRLLADDGKGAQPGAI